MKFTWLCWPMIGVTFVTSPAWSQEQTVEGAQSFLTQFAERGPFVVEDVFAFYSGTQYFRRSMGRTITSVNTSGDCQSRFEATGGLVVSSDPGDGPLDEKVLQEKYGVSFDIDWSKVNSVKHDPGSSDVKLYPGADGFWQYKLVRTGSPDWAARMAFAMEFLRLNCDETARTGF